MSKPESYIIAYLCKKTPAEKLFHYLVYENGKMYILSDDGTQEYLLDIYLKEGEALKDYLKKLAKRGYYMILFKKPAKNLDTSNCDVYWGDA